MSDESLETKIRLVAIDLDGTLLNDSKQVSTRTIGALQCLPAQGVRVILATARPPRGVRHIYNSLKLDTWTINYNGALIWDEPNRRGIFHRPMAPSLVTSIIQRARLMHPEVLVSCEIMDQWFTDRAEQTYTTETGRLYKPDYIGPLEEFLTQPITKLMLLGHPAIIGNLERVIQLIFSDRIASVSEQNLLQVMDRRVGKSTALQKLAKHYDIPMAQVMAIGDAPNDVGMVQLAGVGVAMDNAHPRVKQIANWVAPSNNDHGVHAALQRYGLCP